MFSTSVLESRASLEPATVPVMRENNGRVILARPVGRHSGPGLYMSDKENRPAVEKASKGAWWMQQRQADVLQQQVAQEKIRASAEEQLQQVRSARRTEVIGPQVDHLTRRCQELEAQQAAKADAILRLEARLQRQTTDMTAARQQLEADLRAEKDRADRLSQLLRGSEAADRVVGLHEIRDQVQQLSRQADLHKEQLAALSNRRLASQVVRAAVLHALGHSQSTSDGLEDAAVQVELVAETSEELRALRSELAEAQAAAEVRRVCSREVQEGLQEDCERWQRHAEGLEKQVDELGRSTEGCKSCADFLKESQELALTVTALKKQCEALEVEKKSLTSKVTSLQETLEDVSSSHAELAGHANHRQKIRHTVQLKEDRDNLREENFRLKQRILQLEAGNSSQGIVEAVAGYAGADRGRRMSARPSRSAGSVDSVDCSHRPQMLRCQQLERELERNKINVSHFMALIERAVSAEGEAKCMGMLLQSLRERFLENSGSKPL